MALQEVMVGTGSLAFVQNFLEPYAWEFVRAVNAAMPNAFTYAGTEGYTTGVQYADYLYAMVTSWQSAQDWLTGLYSPASDWDTLSASINDAFDTSIEALRGLGFTQEWLLEIEGRRQAVLELYEGTVSDLNQFEQAKLTEIQNAIDAQNDALAEAVQGYAGALATAISEQEQLSNTYLDLAVSARDLRRALLLDSSLSPYSAESRYAEAQAQFRETVAAALEGDTDAAARMEQVSRAYLDVSQAHSATAEQYAVDFAEVQISLGMVEDAMDLQADAADQQLDALQSQLEALQQQHSTLLTIEQTLEQWRAAYEAAQAATTQGQISTAPGATSALVQAVTQSYQNILGRDPDQAGLDHYVQAMLNGATLENVVASLMASDEYRVGQGYVPAQSAAEQQQAAAAQSQAANVASTLDSFVSESLPRFYENWFGREADAEGLAYWASVAAAAATDMNTLTETIGQINAAFGLSDELAQVNPTLSTQFRAASGIPGYASGGAFGAGDLAIVGEEGWEFARFDSPGRVYSHGQSAGMLDAVVASLDALRAELQATQVPLVRNSNYQAKFIERIEREGMPVVNASGTTLATEAA